MAEEEKVVEATKEVDKKEPSKTDVYKKHLQMIIYQELGVKVSKDKAWGLFKAIQHGTVEFVLNLEDHRLPLAGVGSFEVIETKPRKTKAGLDKDGNPIEGAEVWPCVPRYRYYPSTVVDGLVEKTYGLGDHDDIKVEHYGLYATDSEDVKSEETSTDVESEEVTGEVPAETSAVSDEFAGLDEI